MSIASQRKGSPKLGGAATASNETPVGSAEQPAPGPGDNTDETRTKRPGKSQGAAQDGLRKDDYRAANGRDHPAESEHDHQHELLNGETERALRTEDKKPR